MLLGELGKATKSAPSQQQAFPGKYCKQEPPEQKPQNHLKQSAI
jgi:hypothetical protein